jgi:putative peptide zinc metalloprotease protein
MTGAIATSAWYRVASLRPQLRAHARLHRHRYRGEVWYLLQDPISNRVHRFTPAARLFIAAMNGQRSVQAILELVQQQLAEDAPSQDEVIQLLGQLHAADLLKSDVSPDAAEVFERGDTQRRAQVRRSAMNPMALKLHLFDPDALLNRLAAPIQALWSRWGLLLWVLVVLPALLLVPPHWAALTGNLSERVLAVDNLLLLWLVFPLIKAAHELGHAVAVKRGGGEVHDVGVVLLVLLPVPYVEASASSVFRSKWERAMVGAAGMVVELFIAALAFYLWLLLEPGPVRALLFNVMLVAGVSTLVFNGNPLLRYDAYYILADLIEMPNLGQRALKYWAYLIERYAFGLELESPAHTPREKAWLLGYGALSTVYRVMVTVGIAWFIAGQFFFVGVALAIWAVASMALLPLAKGIGHVVSSPRLHAQRGRARAVTAGTVLALGLGLFVLPAPLRTATEGVVWLPEDAQVRPEDDAFVERLLVAPGERVARGQPLAVMRQPTLESDLRLAQARLAEAEAVHAARLPEDRVQAGIADEQREQARAVVGELERRVQALVLKAPREGWFVMPRPADAPGRHLHKGDALAYVIDRPTPLVRVVVQQDAVDLVRRDTQGVKLRLSHRPGQEFNGRVVREVPGGGDTLPSRALGVDGGGTLAVDPRDPQVPKTLERTFQFDVQLDEPEAAAGFYGARVHVRFDHRATPLGVQWLQALRRQFLSHFMT